MNYEVKVTKKSNQGGFFQSANSSQAITSIEEKKNTSTQKKAATKTYNEMLYDMIFNETTLPPEIIHIIISYSKGNIPEIMLPVNLRSFHVSVMGSDKLHPGVFQIFRESDKLYPGGFQIFEVARLLYPYTVNAEYYASEKTQYLSSKMKLVEALYANSNIWSALFCGQDEIVCKQYRDAFVASFLATRDKQSQVEAKFINFILDVISQAIIYKESPGAMFLIYLHNAALEGCCRSSSDTVTAFVTFLDKDKQYMKLRDDPELPLSKIDLLLGKAMMAMCILVEWLRHDLEQFRGENLVQCADAKKDQYTIDAMLKLLYSAFDSQNSLPLIQCCESILESQIMKDFLRLAKTSRSSFGYDFEGLIRIVTKALNPSIMQENEDSCRVA